MDNEQALVRTSAVGFSSGYRWSARRSSWGQLIWASRGAISATTAARLWVIPAGRALWIPADTSNEVLMQGRGVLRTLFIAPHTAPPFRTEPRLVRIPPLLQQLIRRAFEHDALHASDSRQSLVAALLMQELQEALDAPGTFLELPLPRDARALRAAEQMRAQPGVPLSALRLDRSADASRRTLERLFLAQTGLTLGEWHQRNALMHGLRQLAEGSNVAQAAVAAGYAGSSAFVYACRRLTGMTPGALSRADTNRADRSKQKAEDTGLPVSSASP